DIRLVTVAVERVIDGVIDEIVVPAPALEPARVAVFRPADLAAPEIDDLVLSMTAAPRPEAGLAHDIVEDVETTVEDGARDRSRGRGRRRGHRRRAGDEQQRSSGAGERANRRPAGGEQRAHPVSVNHQPED